MEISLEKASELLQKEHIIAVPTETVYGIAGLYDSEKACSEIFFLKERPHNKPLSVLISNISQLNYLTPSISEDTEKLMKAFWPGPLTLALPSIKHLPCMGSQMVETIGVRMPNHALTLDLLEKTGPLACPSANPSTLPPPIDAESVKNYFQEGLPILNGGITEKQCSSTVLAKDKNRWVVLRKGCISADDLKIVLGYAPLEVSLSTS